MACLDRRPRHSTSLYEIIALAAATVVLAKLDRRDWKGTLVACLVLRYGVGRPLTEVFRGACVGISFMSIHGLKREIRHRQFKKLPVAGLRLQRPSCLVGHRDKHTSPAMEAFLTLALKAFRETEAAVG